MYIEIVCYIIMVIAVIMVFYAMIGYPIFLLILNKIKKNKSISKADGYEPLVSYMIVAHNEEKCIYEKLSNILTFNYPINKIQILIASDFCTDRTNEIIQKFIDDNPELNITLNLSLEHKGKTNAQNETQKYAKGDILIMTDANSIFDKNAIRELVSYFTDKKIAYVCGQLKYLNDDNLTAASESTYWKFDLKQREIESKIQTITAGNGSIYAIRNEYYIDINPIHCHDSEFPRLFALKKLRALYNPNAIAYEKAGETNGDEFKRKVRMNRSILDIFKEMWRPLNIFRYKWYSIFYFGHRTCRYLLWFNHLLFFLTSIVFTCIGYYIVGGIIIGLQILFFALGFISIHKQIRVKPLRIVAYYSMTVLAQFVGAIKQMFGLSKPVWEKAESTR